jgi:hypothetical protein
MKNTKIYLVTNCYGDPNKVYIGKTKNSRKNNHYQTYGKDIVYTYIDEVDSLDRKHWKPLESYWIEQFRQWGFEVMNKNKGGGGLSFLTEEVKIKIGKGNLGKKKPGVTKHLKGKSRNSMVEETKIKISKALKGKKRPNISESKQGMKLTEDWKYKISESTKGNTNRLGTKQSQETKDKISEALKGKKRPQDVIKKMKKPKNDVSNFGKHRKGVKAGGDTIEKLKQSHESYQKPVLQFDKKGNFIKEFNGVREAARQTGCYDSAITMCCKERLKTTKGFIFKYKN